MDNILIYSATEDNFYIWQRALPLSRIARGQTNQTSPVRVVV
jgi:hypothetical protein